MSQKFYSLQRILNGENLFISKNDMNKLTDDPNEALAFSVRIMLKYGRNVTHRFQMQVSLK